MDKQTGFIIRMMRKVTKQMAIRKVVESTAHSVLNEMIKEAEFAAENSNSFIEVHSLVIWKQTFIHDYYEKGIAKCKTCGKEDSTLEMRGIVCTNCY